MYESVYEILVANFEVANFMREPLFKTIRSNTPIWDMIHFKFGTSQYVCCTQWYYIYLFWVAEFTTYSLLTSIMGPCGLSSVIKIIHMEINNLLK